MQDGYLLIILRVPVSALKNAVKSKGKQYWGISFVALPSLSANGAEKDMTATEVPDNAEVNPHTFELKVDQPLRCILRSHGEDSSQRNDDNCYNITPRSRQRQKDGGEKLDIGDESVENNFCQLTITGLKVEYVGGVADAWMDGVTLEDLRPASERPMIPVSSSLPLNSASVACSLYLSHGLMWCDVWV